MLAPMGAKNIVSIFYEPGLVKWERYRVIRSMG